MIFKLKGSDKVALVTDAIRAAGFNEGEYVLGDLEDGLRIIVEDNVAKLADRSSLAGSVATMDRIVRTVWKQAGIPLADVVRSATQTPARIMGFGDCKGEIKTGYDADIVIFDEDVNVSDVIIGGKRYS